MKTMIARGCTGVQDCPRSVGKKSVDSSKISSRSFGRLRRRRSLGFEALSLDPARSIA